MHWTFPWPPPPTQKDGKRHSISLNHMYVWTGRGGQRRLSAYAEAAKHLWMVCVRGSSVIPSFPETGPLALTIRIYPPNAIRRDTDGCVKLVQDALFEAYREHYLARGADPVRVKAACDDYRVTHLDVRRCAPDKKNPRIEVVIDQDREAA